MTQPIQRVWFITGASTGLGRLLAEEVLKSGGKVVATARKLDKVADLEERYPKAAKALALDVTDAGQVDSAVTQAFAQFGQVDVLVNNAGYGVAGAIEEVSEDEFMPMFETNVFSSSSSQAAQRAHSESFVDRWIDWRAGHRDV